MANISCIFSNRISSTINIIETRQMRQRFWLSLEKGGMDRDEQFILLYQRQSFLFSISKKEIFNVHGALHSSQTSHTQSTARLSELWTVYPRREGYSYPPPETDMNREGHLCEPGLGDIFVVQHGKLIMFKDISYLVFIFKPGVFLGKYWTFLSHLTFMTHFLFAANLSVAT